ncbi:MAG: 30S ribosomal protein S6, partial [Proteobacteria bacterium]
METSKVTVKRPYEVIVVVHPDATVDEQKELFRKNKTTIEGFAGSVFSLETWGKRNLANPIGKLPILFEIFCDLVNSSRQADGGPPCNAVAHCSCRGHEQSSRHAAQGRDHPGDRLPAELHPALVHQDDEGRLRR